MVSFFFSFPFNSDVTYSLVCKFFDFHLHFYLQGGDLFDAITSSTKYTERDGSAMVYNLASALKYLHGLSIVHRDIKPENLLVYFLFSVHYFKNACKQY